MYLRIICYTLLTSSLILSISCRHSPQNNTDTQYDQGPGVQVIARYQGILPSPEYDSIANKLTLYEDETFDLNQVDRLAEHHLNEKDHTGLYAYLADSTRMGLYSMDGYLMLQFLLTDAGLVPMILDTDIVIDSTIVWRQR